MTLIMEEGIRSGICHNIHWYEKHVRDYNKIQNHHILCTETWIIYMDGYVTSYLWMVLSELKNTAQFHEDCVNNYNEDGDIGYFLVVDVKYSKQLHKTHNDLAFFARKNENWKASKTSVEFQWQERIC